MLRQLPFLVVTASLLVLSAFVAQQHPSFSDQVLHVNSTEEARMLPLRQHLSKTSAEWSFMDSESTPNVLMFNYSAYDSAYANKVKRLIQKGFPKSVLTDFWDGTEEQLRQLLLDKHLVVVPYPANGMDDVLNAHAKVLHDYVRQGGNVIFLGTHKYATLREFNLLEIGSGYYCRALNVHETAQDHPILEGTPEDFLTADVLYPLDVEDPDFVALAEVSGFPVIGYKILEHGRIGYLGIEYYHDDAIPATILMNTIKWMCKEQKQQQQQTRLVEAGSTGRKSVTRSEQQLYAGSGALADYDLKIYPNPFVSRATLDLDLPSAMLVSVDVTDEAGKVVSTLLSRRNLQVATYHFEFPNVSPGIYFVRCHLGGQKIVRKVVKLSNQ